MDVVASVALSTAALTIADDLAAYQKGGGYQLTLTPASAAGGTTTIVAKDERGEVVTETFDLRGTTVQKSKNRFIEVTSVTNASYTGGTVVITAMVAKTREIQHGYGKGVDTGGIGIIKAIRGGNIYFDR